LVAELVYRKRRVFQLQDRQEDRRGVDGADVPPAAGARPAAVARLALDQVVKRRLLVFAPGDALLRRQLGQALADAVGAEDVQGRGVVVVRVLVMTHARVAGRHRPEDALAVPEPLLDKGRVVFAGAEAAGDGRRRQGRPFAAGRRPAATA